MTKRKRTAPELLSPDEIAELWASHGDDQTALKLPWKPCSHYPKNRTPEQKLEDQKTEIRIMIEIAWQNEEIKADLSGLAYRQRRLLFSIEELESYCLLKGFKPKFLTERGLLSQTPEELERPPGATSTYNIDGEVLLIANSPDKECII